MTRPSHLSSPLLPHSSTPSPVLMPTSPAPPSPNKPQPLPHPSSPTALSLVVLDTLLCALVDRPRNMRSFEVVGGLASVVKVLKDKSVAQVVRYSLSSFLPPFADPSTPGSKPSRSSTTTSSPRLPPDDKAPPPPPLLPPLSTLPKTSSPLPPPTSSPPPSPTLSLKPLSNPVAPLPPSQPPSPPADLTPEIPAPLQLLKTKTTTGLPAPLARHSRPQRRKHLANDLAASVYQPRLRRGGIREGRRRIRKSG